MHMFLAHIHFLLSTNKHPKTFSNPLARFQKKLQNTIVSIRRKHMKLIMRFRLFSILQSKHVAPRNIIAKSPRTAAIQT